MKTKTTIKKGILTRILKIIGIMLVFFTFSNSWAIHPDLDTADVWVEVNDGFAKCAPIEESAGEAFCSQDQFRVVDMLHRQGSMYAYIKYVSSDDHGNEPSNPTDCSRGLFRHDTITNKWIRVANMTYESGYQRFQLRTNGEDIFAIQQGMVYKLVEDDYDTYPTGWKNITDERHRGDYPIIGQYVFEHGDCYSHTMFNEQWQLKAMDAIGDTIFSVHTSIDSKCNHKLAKFSIKDGIWSSVDLPPFPAPENKSHFIVTDKIAGIFQVFYSTRSGAFPIPWDTLAAWDNGWGGGNTGKLSSEDIKHLYVFDPRNNEWRDISRGPNYDNLTGGGFKPDGTKFFTSWDRQKVFVNTQQGIFEWQGDRWEHVVNRGKGPALITTNGFFFTGATHSGTLTGGGGYAERFINAVFQRIGPMEDYNYACFKPETDSDGNIINDHDSLWEPKYNRKYDDFVSPDDGHTIYSVYGGSCHYGGEVKLSKFSECGRGSVQGIYRLRIDPNKPGSVRNLHVEAATYLGGSSDENMAVNTGVGAHYNLYVAGNFSGVEGRKSNDFFEEDPLGAGSDGKAKIQVLNTLADTLLGVIHLGEALWSYKIQNVDPFRMVVTGDFGVVVLDSAARNVLFHRTHQQLTADGLGGTNQDIIIADIDDNGSIVVFRGDVPGRNSYSVWYKGGYGGAGSSSGEAFFIVYDKDGNFVSNNRSRRISSGKGIYGIAIQNDTVFALYQRQANIQALDSDYSSCKDAGGYNGQPVQQPVVRAYVKTDDYTDHIWQTWGFTGYNETVFDMADAMPRQINVGADGKLYFLGEAAGGNSVYRWNGQETRAKNFKENGFDQDYCSAEETMVYHDNYSRPVMTGAAHLAYFCTIDPATGVVERGQYLIPRLKNGYSNTFTSSKGYIHADAMGYVYVLGKSSASYDGRDVQFVNGRKVGAYGGGAGDGVIAMISPDYTARTMWVSLSEKDYTDGYMTGIGIRDNVITAVQNSDQGKHRTGATRVVDEYYNTKEFKDEWAINEFPLSGGGDSSGVDGVYEAHLAVWWQDVWNHAQDTLDPNPIESDTIMCDSAFFCGADFKVKEIPVPDYLWDQQETDISVCVDQDITFSDMSTCATEWHWEFGSGAKVAPYYLVSEADGIGPWTVKYSTPGLKTIKLTTGLLSKNVDCEDTLIYDTRERQKYVNVIDNDQDIGEIKGPENLCAGQEGIFEVEYFYGVEEYVWNIPPDATIKDGQGANKVRIQFGTTNPAEISVYAKTPCGNTETKTKTVDIADGTEENVLLVVGSDRIVVDNNDPGFTYEGTHVENLIRTDKTPFIGANWSLVRRAPHESGATSATYTPTVPESGVYDVAFHYPLITTSHSLTCEIHYDGGVETKVINQHLTGGQWIDLGSYPFAAGSSGHVKFYTNDGAYLDAISFKPRVSSGLTDADSALLQFFEDLGYGVIVRTSDEVVKEDAGCAVLGMISPTAEAEIIGYELREVGIPVIVSQPDLYAYMDMTRPYDRGRKHAEEEVTIETENHELAGGLSGDHNIYQSPGEMNWGTPGGVPIELASITSGDDSELAIFAYDTDCGTMAYDFPVPAKRVGFYMGRNGMLNLTADGEKLFEQAVCWTMGNCEEGVNAGLTVTDIKDRDNISNLTFCAGDSIHVEYTATGTFGLANAGNACNPNNVFTAQLSNSEGSFAGDPVEIGQVERNDAETGIIPGRLPADLAESPKFRIRVVSTSPSIITPAYGFNITINGYPEPPAPISGVSEPCVGDNIQTYSVPAGYNQYRWEVPLGARIIEPLAEAPKTYTYTGPENEIKVDFGTSTENSIKVWGYDNCGWSKEHTSLKISMNQVPPENPGAIGGMATICPGGDYNYSITTVNRADYYEWEFPNFMNSETPSLAFSGDTTSVRNITLMSDSDSDGSTGLIRVRPWNHCGPSQNWSSKEITVDATSAPPQLDNISVSPIPGSCPGLYRYSINSILDATDFDWNLPLEATIVEDNMTSVDVSWTAPYTGNISVDVTNACGTATSTLSVNISDLNNNVLLHVGNEGSLTTDDINLRDRLTGLGYQAVIVDDDENLGSTYSCYLAVVISPSAHPTDNDISFYTSKPIPVVACQNREGHTNHVFYTLQMINKNSYGGPNYANRTEGSSIFITDNNHDITFGLNTGLVSVFSQPEDLEYGIFHSHLEAYSLAVDDLNQDNNYLFTYNKGDVLFDNSLAPHRRAGLFIGPGTTGSLTTEGWQIFDQAICWAIGNCPFAKTEVTTQLGDNYCPGDPITVDYEVSGDFDPDNTFTLELSDQNGNFNNPLKVASQRGTEEGSFSTSLPWSGIGNGTDFKLRVKGSNPAEGVYIASSSFSIRSPYVNIGDDITFSCDGSQADLSVEPGYSNYEWNTGATGNTLTTAGEGLYWVHVQNIWGCESRDTTEFVMFESDLFTGNLDSSDFCPDDPIHVPFGLCPAAKPCVSGFLFDKFDKQALDPVWKRIEYGGTSGTARETINNTLRVETDGGDISGYRTEFFATYRSDIEGDFEVVAKITAANFSSTSTRSFLGIVAANNFESNEVSHGRAVYAGFRQDGSGKMNLRLAGRLDNSGGNVNEWRPESGEVFYDEFQDFSVFPVYLRLRKERSGSQTTFSLSYSHDSVSWSTEATLTNDLVTENMDIGFAAAKPGEMEVDGFYTNVPGYFDTRSYEYVLQLSERDGSFDSPTNVDTLVLSGNQVCQTYEGTFMTQMPSYLPDGNQYRVRTIQVTPDDVRDTSEVSNTVINIDCMECPDFVVDSLIQSTSCIGSSDGSIEVWLDDFYAPYDLYWSSGDTIENYSDTSYVLSGLEPGTYSLTIRDTGDCVDIRSYTVPEADSLYLIDSISNIKCYGHDDGFIEITPTGGAIEDSFTVEWAHGADSTVLFDLEPGTYELTVSDANSCTATESYTITQPDSISLSATVTEPSGFGTGDGNINLEVTGGTSPYNYVWDSGYVTQDISNVGGGLYNVEITDDNGCQRDTTFAVNEPSDIDVSDTISNVTCHGGSDGRIAIHVSGGSKPYNMPADWSSMTDSTFERTGLSAGTYNLNFYDDNGIFKIVSFNVNQRAEMVVDFTTSTGDTVICKGSNMEITATTPGGEDYNWSNSDTTQSITVNNTTTTKYIVTITDSSGICSTVDSVTIIAVPGAVTNLQDETAKCGNRDSVRITAASNSTYDYLWNTGETSQSINAGLGMYMVTVTNTYGCLSYDTTQIVDYTAVPANITNSDSTVCSGGDIDLTASDAGVSQFRWSNDSTGGIVTISNVTIQQQYGLTITDNNGCTSTDEITVLVDTLPGAVIEGDQQMYTNCSETYSVKDADFINYTYEFSAPGADITDNGTGEADISWYSDGSKTINLTVTDNNTDCSSQKVYNVEVKPAPAINAPDAVTASCYNSDSVALDFSIVDVFKTYQVYVNDVSLGGGNSAKSYSANVSTGMDATIKLDAGVGCAEQIQLVIVEMPSEPTVSLRNLTTQLCANDKGELSVTYTPSTANVSWVNYDGASQSTISSLDTGMYKVRVSTSQDCFIEDSFEISYYDNTLDFEIETEDAYCHKASDGEVRLVPITGQIIDAEWYSEITGNKLGFGDVSGITGLRAGKYYVRVISINDCEFTKEIEIANENASCINIPTAFTPNGDGVHDYWVIENLYTFYPNATVNVYNRIGERVFSNEGSKERWDGTMNGVPVPVSTYHYIIDLNDGSAPLTGQITILR